MSRAIVYCDVCAKIVLPSEIQAGSAIVGEEHAFCAACSHLAPKDGGALGADLRASRRRGKATAGTRHGMYAALAAGVLGMVAAMGVMALVRHWGASDPRPVQLADEVRTVSTAEAAVPQPQAPSQALPERGHEVALAPASVGIAPAPPSALSAATSAAPAEEPPPAPGTDDTYDIRGGVAQLKLAEAKALREADPNDVFAFRRKLEELRRSFDGTPASAEAARLLEEVRLPELPPERNPQPPPADAWGDADHVLGADPRVQTLAGNWSVVGGHLRSDRSMWAKAALPYLLPEEYDIRVTFSRIEGSDCLVVALARRGRPFVFCIGSGNSEIVFGKIRESAPDVLPTRATHSGVLTNNVRCEIVILVRNACLRAYVDGVPAVGCQVDDDGLSIDENVRMPMANQAGLATWASVCELYSFDVRPVNGRGTFIP